MTVAISYRLRDGSVLLCADQKLTSGSEVQTTVKIFERTLLPNGGQIIFSLASDDVARAIGLWPRVALAAAQTGTADDLITEITTACANFYSDVLEGEPQRPEIEFVAAIWRPDTKRVVQLARYDAQVHAVAVPNRYCAVGSGSQAAGVILKGIGPRAQTQTECIRTAIAAVKAAKMVDPLSGGDTDAWILRNGETVHKLTAGEIQEVEQLCVERSEQSVTLFLAAEEEPTK